MHISLRVIAFSLICASASAAPNCRQASIEGELTAGRSWSHPLGNGLRLYFQSTESGWITRVLPEQGPVGDHDYAELASPPYQSLTPLSISTDFAFRAQDAVGWNPRRFRFATSADEFSRLLAAYQALVRAGKGADAQLQSRLGQQIAQATDATLTILDARLMPGTADQWVDAASVASHFLTTAHTLVLPPDGRATPLGRLLSVRFRMMFRVPAGFRVAPGVQVSNQACGTS